MRLFVVAELSQETKLAAGKLLARLQARHPAAAEAVKWVVPQNLHLTLKFLGSVEASQTLLLQQALASTAAACVGSFRLALACGGVFWERAPRRPRVLWLGPSETP